MKQFILCGVLSLFSLSTFANQHFKMTHHFNIDESVNNIQIMNWMLKDYQAPQIQELLMMGGYQQVEPDHYQKEIRSVNLHVFLDRKHNKHRFLVEAELSDQYEKFGKQYRYTVYNVLHNLLGHYNKAVKKISLPKDVKQFCSLNDIGKFGKCSMKQKSAKEKRPFELHAYAVSGSNLNWVFPNISADELKSSREIIKFELKFL